MIKPGNRAVVLFIFLFAFFLRVWDVAIPAQFVGDEFMFIPSSENFIRNGLFSPNIWHHPPLSAHLTVLSMKLFGNNPYGWRMANVIFGSLSVLMLMLIAGQLFSDRRIAWLSGIFFATEPFHIVLSRTNFSEVPAIFFFLLFIYAIGRYLRDDAPALIWAGIPLGLAFSGKWYFMAPLFTVLLLLLIRLWTKPTGKDRIIKASYLASCLVTAAGVYLLSFYPWFQRGAGLYEFFLYQYDSYATLQALGADNFLSPFLKSSPSKPWLWFIKPLISGNMLYSDGLWAGFFVFMNNPPVWLAVLPSSIYALCRLKRKWDETLLLTLLLFISSYLQFVIVRRPVFLYSALPVLPFAYVLIASSAADITGDSHRGRKIFFLIMCGVMLWGLYLYPFVTGRTVPAFLYDYLLPAIPH